MRNRVNRQNNGYIGRNLDYAFDSGVVNINKQYSTIVDAHTSSDEYPNPYTPPSEWVPLPNINVGEQKFVGVHAVWNDFANFVALTAHTSTGNYLVDWGDGTTSSAASNVPVYKQYTPTTYAGLTSAVYQEYKTVLITVTPITGNLTKLFLNTNHNQTNLNGNRTKGWLNCKIAGQNINEVNWSTCRMLEQIEFVGENNINSMYSHFNGLNSLKKIVQYYTGKATRFDLCFNGTPSLSTIPRFDFSSVSPSFGLSQMFYGAAGLKYVPWMNTSNINSFVQTFHGCNSLRKAPDWDTSNATSMSGMFVACSSLSYVPFYNTSQCTNFSNMFQDCWSLKTIPKFDTSNGTNFTFMFYSARLQEFPELDTSKGITFTSMFFQCILKQNKLKINCSSAHTVAGMFSNSGVEEVDVVSTENCKDFSYMFSSCSALTTVKGLCAGKGENFDQMFSGGQSLRYIDFTIPTALTGASYGVNAFRSFFNQHYNIASIGLVDVSGLSGPTYANAFSNMFLETRSMRSIGLTGLSQNLNITGCILGATQLNDLYRSLAVVGVSGAGAKTITVTNNWGALNDDPSIAIAKGWTVTG